MKKKNSWIPVFLILICMLGESLHAQTETLSIPVQVEPTPAPTPGKTITRLIPKGEAKPIGIVPYGWKLQVLPNMSMEAPEIRLGNGKIARPKYAPYLLVPDAKPGSAALQEPGYDSQRSEQDQGTLSAVMDRQIRAEEVALAQMDTLIAQLKESVGNAKKEAKIQTPAGSVLPSPSPSPKRNQQPPKRGETPVAPSAPVAPGAPR